MELGQLIQPGNKVKIDYGKNNVNTRTLHILAIVDGDRVVCKWWERRWFYGVESMYYFSLLNEEKGRLKKMR